VATVIRKAAIEAPAEHSWAALRDFGALHERLAVGFVTSTTMVSDRDREVTFFTGAVARERLIGIDDEAMRLAYSVVEGPMGATHHNASAQIVPDGPDRCTFVWITDVLPDELGDRTAGLMDAGLRAMKSALEGATTSPPAS
jgi:Polyketide cyclase / dehydrase and lipid transport